MKNKPIQDQSLSELIKHSNARKMKMKILKSAAKKDTFNDIVFNGKKINANRLAFYKRVGGLDGLNRMIIFIEDYKNKNNVLPNDAFLMDKFNISQSTSRKLKFEQKNTIDLFTEIKNSIES